jgi:predicted transcriptional regulator
VPTSTVRVTPETRAVLLELAKESKQPMQHIVARAVEQLRRQMVLERATRAYASLRARPDMWKEERDERLMWDGAIADDLENVE